MTLILLKTYEVGRILGLTPGGVRAIRAKGRLRPVVVTADGTALYDPRDVEALRQQREAERAARDAEKDSRHQEG